MTDKTYYETLVERHIEKFGVEPVVTGISFEDSDKLIDLIEQAIINGVPYVEEEPPEGAIV